MAGHSKWAKIHRGKAIEDAKRGGDIYATPAMQ